jgi:hypothetical protein
MRSACCILLTLASASVAHASFDTADTHAGNTSLSGRRENPYSHAPQMLLETNNDLVHPEVITPPTGPGGDRLSAMQIDAWSLGHLMDGPQGMKFTYDRLVAQRVLQIIEYTLEPLSTTNVKTDATPSSVSDLKSGIPADRNSDSSSRASQVPEPTAASALVLGLAVLMSRRLGRRATTRGSPP